MKVVDWITVLDREGIVTRIGMEHVTLLTQGRECVSLANDLVIQSGVTNFTRPGTTQFWNVVVEAAYRIPPEEVCATLLETAAAVTGVLVEPKATALVTAFNESAINIGSSSRSVIMRNAMWSRAPCGPISGMLCQNGYRDSVSAEDGP